MIRKVIDNLTRKYGRVRKELDKLMGGKVLEFKGERLYNKGKAEGKVQGQISELVELVCEGMLGFDVAAQKASSKYNIPVDDFRKMVDEYKPDRENQLEG